VSVLVEINAPASDVPKQWDVRGAGHPQIRLVYIDTAGMHTGIKDDATIGGVAEMY
jgi:hypothetical protein